jgi:hypothetical protein
MGIPSKGVNATILSGWRKAADQGEGQREHDDHPERRALTRADLRAAIMEGAVERVRHKMMTVTAITAGLPPILWNDGTVWEVMQRIAVPMIGGTASSTLLTLLVIPAVHGLVKGWHLRPLTSNGAILSDTDHTAVDEKRGALGHGGM